MRSRSRRKVFGAKFTIWIGAVASLGSFFGAAALGGDVPTPDWCVTDGDYNPIVKNMTADLRWSLFAISTLADSKGIDAAVILDLTDASVISLANTLSLRASYARDCSIGQDDYNQKIHDSQAFVALILGITSDERFPAFGIIRDKYPDLLLSDSPTVVLRTQHLPPPNQTILRRLLALKGETPFSDQSPYVVAARLLLGWGPEWREKQLNVVPIILGNPGSQLYGKTLADSLNMLANKTSIDLLNDLRGYYNKPSKGAPGIPSLLVKIQ